MHVHDMYLRWVVKQGLRYPQPKPKPKPKPNLD